MCYFYLDLSVLCTCMKQASMCVQIFMLFMVLDIVTPSSTTSMRINVFLSHRCSLHLSRAYVCMYVCVMCMYACMCLCVCLHKYDVSIDSLILPLASAGTRATDYKVTNFVWAYWTYTGTHCSMYTSPPMLKWLSTLGSRWIRCIDILLVCFLFFSSSSVFLVIMMVFLLLFIRLLHFISHLFLILCTFPLFALTIFGGNE